MNRDSNNNSSNTDQRRSEYFKSILNSKYLRTKIFKDVGIIHHKLYCRQGQPIIYRLKSHEIISLKECIIVNRTDLFIKHFDQVFKSVNRDQDNFNSLLITALKNQWRPTKSSLSILMNHITYFQPTGYAHLVLWLPVTTGDLEMFDHICQLVLDPVPNGTLIFPSYGYCDHLPFSFKHVINKLNQHQQHTTNNNNNNESKYEIIYYMVNKLKEYGMDIRGNLFVDALKCDNNQEIIKWIKDSYEKKEGFIEQESYSFSIMVQTALDKGHLEYFNILIQTIERIVIGIHYYGRIKVESVNPSIMTFNLVTRLFANQYLQVSVTELALIAIKAKQFDILQHILNLYRAQEGYLDTNRLIFGALCIDDTTNIEYLLNRYYNNDDDAEPTTRSKSFQVTTDNICDMMPQPLEYLYSLGHSLDIRMEQSQSVLAILKQEKKVPSLEILQLIIKYQPIATIHPSDILSRFGYCDDDIHLLKDALSLVSDIAFYDIKRDTLIKASKNGLVKTVECLVSNVHSFEDSFSSAIKYKQIKVAKYLTNECISLVHFIEEEEEEDEIITPEAEEEVYNNLFSEFLGGSGQSNKEIWETIHARILPSFYYIGDDETFESFWNDFKSFSTTNSSVVSKLLEESPFDTRYYRRQISNTIDRIILNYSRFYNGPERDQYQMQPLQLPNPSHPFNTYYIISKYRHDPQFNQIINFNDFDINQFYIKNNNLLIDSDNVFRLDYLTYNGPERDQYQMEPLRLSSYNTFVTYYIISKYRHDPQFNQIINFNDFDINQFYNKNQSIGLIPFN
ncbi:hypothetical protein DFA_04984 [Cavenderia fasciculata]|uniref:Uncharacterized protein n=1 Tax=Cavenderia fasciculata TaxID=261658 RepID=F4PMQ7_CACFS|nr:uncharacterized protein DFA_04984 [Cavenderia fasciculata]EGG22854.1 hypothetical protein DFA_04984 [Cavenderia fasciculata]|eukprot:XP_004360705.1 hypothetical protein DFA_04984 [Cavenderia fasciculata]